MKLFLAVDKRKLRDLQNLLKNSIMEEKILSLMCYCHSSMLHFISVLYSKDLLIAVLPLFTL